MSDGFYLVEDGRIVGEIPSEFVEVEETPDGVRFIVHGPVPEADKGTYRGTSESRVEPDERE